MKKIIYIIVVCLTMGILSGCTQYNFDDTGLANGKHDMTMWEYFKGDSYNWDSLCVMTERAGLVSLFQGTSQYGKNITFFGPTNNSIRRYLYDNNMERVSDIPVADCRKFILNSVLPNKRVMLDDFKEGVKSSDASTPIGKGGETVEMASGNQLWIYTFRESYNSDRGKYKLPFVSTRIQGVAGTNPINYELSGVKADNQEQAQLFMKLYKEGKISVTGGLIVVTQDAAQQLPNGRYQLSIKVYNEDHEAVLENIFKVVVTDDKLLVD